MIVLILFIVIGCFSVSKSQNGFTANLPLGEYRLTYDKLYPCEPIQNHTYRCNVYFNKRTSSITEMRGNFTFLKPFDDNYTLDINFASWGSIGGWKPNAIVYKTKNACSELKKVLGNIWFTIVKAFNFPTANCPLPVGTFATSSGINLQELKDHGFPKMFFYGNYKASFKLKNGNNKINACMIVELTLLRPWE